MNTKIYFKSSAGFGNKIFELISALYAKYKYNCTVYLSVPISKHDTTIFSPKFSEIFYESNKKIKYIPVRIYRKLKEANKLTNIQINKITDFPNSLENKLYRFSGTFSCAFDMYTAIPYKKLLEINPKMINDKIKHFSNTKYNAIHIRYGDKLCLMRKDTKFPVYTPQFYINMINILNKQNIPIIILTDTEDIVKKYIIDKVPNNKLITMIDSNYVEAFYLLTKAKELVLSHSTFSFAAAYFNPTAKCYLVKKIVDHTNQVPEDTALNPKWTIIDNKDYLLQYNKPLVSELIKEFKKCR
jgi:hypothetical protein